MGILAKLDRQDAVRSSAIQAVPAWKEVAEHIRTGDDGNRGRVYFRRCGERLEVVVHYKKDDKEQRRLLRGLAGRGPCEPLGGKAA
jgi:hypothetical protein